MNFDRARFANIAKFLFVLGIAVHFFAFNFNRPRVLILHSYALDYGWVREVNEGLNRVLEGRADFSIHWQYMNTKNHPSLSYKQKAGILARRMIQRLKPRVIIAIDDDAQDFVAKYYVDYPNVSLVFCGVNGEPQDYGYKGAQNVTGILERLPLSAIRDTIPYLVPKSGPGEQIIRVVNLGDKSGTVKRDEDYILSFDWKPLYLMDSVLVSNFKRWKEEVQSLQNRADCIIITNYRQLQRDQSGTGGFVPPKEVMTWTVENSQIPIIGLNGFIVEEGGEIAIAASPYEQGEVAAKMALKILGGTSPKEIPTQRTENFLVYIRDELYKKRKEPLPVIYKAFAQAIGKYFE